jgi:hypothetical protein
MLLWTAFRLFKRVRPGLYTPIYQVRSLPAEHWPRLENTFRGSSAVEQSTVNRLVVGSIPTHGASKERAPAQAGAFSFEWVPSTGRKSERGGHVNHCGFRWRIAASETGSRGFLRSKKNL